MAGAQTVASLSLPQCKDVQGAAVRLGGREWSGWSGMLDRSGTGTKRSTIAQVNVPIHLFCLLATRPNLDPESRSAESNPSSSLYLNGNSKEEGSRRQQCHLCGRAESRGISINGIRNRADDSQAQHNKIQRTTAALAAAAAEHHHLTTSSSGTVASNGSRRLAT